MTRFLPPSGWHGKAARAAARRCGERRRAGAAMLVKGVDEKGEGPHGKE